MRIENSTRTGGVAGRSTARSATNAPAFLVDEGHAAPRVAVASAMVSTTSIEAMLALQAAEDPLAGRRKQVRRGRSVLDALDALKVDLLSGRLSDGHLNQLMALIGQARERSDPGLDMLLDDIELRARVELAKRGLFPAF